MRGFRSREWLDWAALPSASGSPSRSWRTTGHDSSSLVKPTPTVYPRHQAVNISEYDVVLLERVDHPAQLQALCAKRLVHLRELRLPRLGQAEVGDAAVVGRRRAVDQPGLLRPLNELGDRALGQREPVDQSR